MRCIELDIHNYNRTFGTMLSGRVAEKYGFAGLPDDTIHIKARGTAGQSFGAWLARGVTLELAGEGNDYVGKGLSGGRIIIYPPETSAIGKAEENIVVGNTVLYGAIAGECYFRGVAGERFCVRNSGATAVVEGVGDHGCEYMTGGVVVVLGDTGRNLGDTGRNFAAGMSGGIAYVLDGDGNFEQRCNMAQVELEPIKEEDDALERLEHLGGDLETHGRVDVSHDMTRFDAIRLKQLIEQHLHYTNSEVARRILDDWETYLPRFVKVMPVEYRRARSHSNDLVTNEMGKPTGFLEYERIDRSYAPVADRITHYHEFVIPLTEEQLQIQGARCMDCGIPFCHQGCPVNNIIPDWNDLVYREDWHSAMDVLHSTNNFPEVTGRAPSWTVPGTRAG